MSRLDIHPKDIAHHISDAGIDGDWCRQFIYIETTNYDIIIMTVKKLWRCNVCNDVHYGAKPPVTCPTCGAKNAFTLIDYPETLKVIIDDGERLDEVGKLIAVWDKFTENKPFRLNPDHAFITTLAEGELENMKNYGLKYCPCRITVGDAEKDLDLICPCNFFKQPVYKESGECWCGLFVRR